MGSPATPRVGGQVFTMVDHRWEEHLEQPRRHKWFPVTARIRAGLIAFALLVTACTGGGGGNLADGSTGTDSGPTTSLVTGPDSSSPDSTPPNTTDGGGDPVGEPLPVDPEVLIGTLDNGLTYYIRRNTAPGGRAELRLAVNAGSAQEDSDQSGVAHFVEHMMFNGTAMFPRNELTHVLEGFGTTFGADINAFTSFDETVYQLSIPTDDPEIMSTGLDVLREWADRATISEQDAVEERGVVADEFRQRAEGIGGRIADASLDLLLGDSPYNLHRPIGHLDAIEGMESQTLRRYYDKWYRPDLMAVIVVGDVDPAEIESMIGDRFADMTGPAGELEPSIHPRVPAPTGSRARVLIDPDLPSSFVEVSFPGAPLDPGTDVGDATATAREVAIDVLLTRLQDSLSRGDAPYLGVDGGDASIVRGQSIISIDLDADPDALADSLAAVIREVERIDRFGIGAAELQRSVDSFRAGVEQAYQGASSRQDTQFAAEYVDNFLTGAEISSARDRRDRDMAVLDALDEDSVLAEFRRILVEPPPQILAVGPQADSELMPTADELIATAAAVPGEDISPPEAEAAGETELMARPEPAEIVRRTKETAVGSFEVEFANGARVVFLANDIAANSVFLSAVSPGGQSAVADDDVTEVTLGAVVANDSGVGDLDPVQLDRLLSGRVVSAFQFVDVTEEGISASSSTEDAELMLQLTHLRMTRPRIEDSAAAAFLARVEPVVEDPNQIPDLASQIALLDARYGGNDPRYSVLPTPEDLAAFDLDTARRLLADRFDDASDFVFVITGDFDPDTMVDLAARYLGTLPPGDRETVTDYQPDPPPGVVEVRVESGQDQVGSVIRLYTDLEPDTPGLRLEVALLQKIAESRLRDRIREELGATYSPFISIEAQDVPDEQVETYVEISGDPEGLSAIEGALDEVLTDLGEAGPTSEELDTAVGQLSREYELVSNDFWQSTLAFYATHPDESIEDVVTRTDRLRRVTVGDLRDLASRLVPPDHYIQVETVPIG